MLEVKKEAVWGNNVVKTEERKRKADGKYSQKRKVSSLE